MAGLTREQRVAKAAAKAGIPGTMAGLSVEAPETPMDPVTIAVIERRLQNPFGEPSAPVELKDVSMFPRWFNTGNRTDAIWRAKRMGWTGITPEMIVDITQIGTHTLSPDGYVARGERAQEVLMCMPRRAYDQLQMAKTRDNLAKMRDVKGEQHRMAEAASKQFGGDFAEDLHSHVAGPIGSVTDSYERVQKVDPEA